MDEDKVIKGPIEVIEMNIVPAEQALPGYEIHVVKDQEPTEPGFYQYSGGGGVMLFLLDRHGQWWTWFDTGEAGKCAWGYIEQALGVWDLIPIKPQYEGKRQ